MAQHSSAANKGPHRPPLAAAAEKSCPGLELTPPPPTLLFILIACYLYNLSSTHIYLPVNAALSSATCHSITESLLVLPLHRQHQACRSILTSRREESRQEGTQPSWCHHSCCGALQLPVQHCRKPTWYNSARSAAHCHPSTTSDRLPASAPCVHAAACCSSPLHTSCSPAFTTTAGVPTAHHYVRAARFCLWTAWQ